MRKIFKLIVVLLLCLTCLTLGAYTYLHGALEEGAPWALRLFARYFEYHARGESVDACELSVQLHPDRRILEGKAILNVRAGGQPGRSIQLLLNPGLEVTSAKVGGRPARVSRHWCALYVRPQQPMTPGNVVQVQIEYKGHLAPLPLPNGWLSEKECILPWACLWYPTDLKSFSAFACEVTVPEAMTVATGCLRPQESANDGVKTVSWRLKRPVCGISLAAGDFETTTQTHGAAACRVFWPSEGLPEGVDPAEILGHLGSAHGFLCSQFESDEFEALDFVVCRRDVRPLNGANGVIFSGAEAIEEAPSRFALLAYSVAGNWWGSTVAGRWITTRAEASAWMAEGLAEYSARLALRHRRGREAFLRYLEQQRCPPKPRRPLSTVSWVETAWSDCATARAVRVRGAYAMSMLEEALGRDTVVRACRNFLHVHRFGNASYGSLCQELNLAAERDFSEYFLAWFDRPGTFDYALDDVSIDGPKARITIANHGNLSAPFPLEIAFITESEAVLVRSEALADRTEASFEVNAPIRRIVLDPFFACPDMVRANNVWPRQAWPRKTACSPEGGLAITTASEWASDEGDGLTVLTADESEWHRIEMGERLTGTPFWRQDAPGEGYALRFTTTEAYAWTATGGPKKVAEGLKEGPPPMGRDAQEAAARVVEGLDYTAQDLRVSPDARHAAWLDPAGRLRISAVDRPTPQYAAVPGEIISFDWCGPDALACLVALPPRGLPMRCHADYVLYRVPTDNSPARRLELDPMHP